jgi:hypothetical protein
MTGRFQQYQPPLAGAGALGAGAVGASTFGRSTSTSTLRDPPPPPKSITPVKNKTITNAMTATITAAAAPPPPPLFTTVGPSAMTCLLDANDPFAADNVTVSTEFRSSDFVQLLLEFRFGRSSKRRARRPQ